MPIGQVLPEALARGARGAGAPDGTWAAVLTRWEEIAGARLATHARPVGLRAGCLVLAVDHPGWATQVRTVSVALIDRVEAVTGARPERVEVVVRPRPPRASGGRDRASD